MNVYDFDGTIYDGDSTIDFYIFCLKCSPMLARYLPKQIYGLLAYKCGKINKTDFKQYFYSFLQGIPNIENMVQLFWNKNIYKIKTWYLKRKKNNDVIISASPNFSTCAVEK